MFGSETWIVLRTGAACAIIAVIVARIIADRGFKAEDVTIGFLGPSLAALYLLVLAVSLATEWQTIGDASQAATTEASAVRELYWSAAGLPPAQQAYLQDHTRAYAMTVVRHDWPQMRHGQLDSVSERQLITMNNYVLHISPQSAAATNAQQEASSQIGTLFAVRDQRQNDAQQRLPTGLLAGVAVTSIVVAAFPFACGISFSPASVALAATQAALVGIGIVVVIQLNHAYTGPLAVSPSELRSVLRQLSGQ